MLGDAIYVGWTKFISVCPPADGGSTEIVIPGRRSEAEVSPE